MVPTGTGNRENLEKLEGIFQSGKSQGILLKILEKSEKLNWKIERILEKSGKFVSQ